MRIREAVAPLTAAALLAGCGSGNNTIHPIATETTHQSPPTTTNAYAQAEADLIKSLNTYRNDVLVRHRARIVMGTCVGWPNAVNGTTVTLNPGIAESEGNEYYVFSSHDPRYKPDWGPLNGPDFLSPDAEVVIMTRDMVIDAKSKRELLKGERHDSTGQRFFETKKDHEPVLDTVLVPKQLTITGLKNACLKLARHERIVYPKKPQKA